MSQLFDFFPVLLFFVAYKLTDFFVATGVFIVATFAQLLIQWLRTREVKKMHLISAVLVLVFGGITLILQDEEFLKWKVSIVNWLFAAGFLASAYVGERRTIVERLMSEAVELPAGVWRRLNLLWIGFFTVIGLINLYVMHYFSTDDWVDFKTWGVIGLTLLFALLQGVYLARHLPDDVLEDNADEKKES
ncbi:MAG: septation protein A [Gammaproteobacteria bacterium]|nr:septation protein A [Gammaproteobacteria bacterium]